MEKPGLRERKKWETRKRISDVASGLFRERGFDNVTITEIAEAADVSRMTVFNYFDRKEDLYLDRSLEALADYTEAISARPAEQSVVDAVRALQHRWLTEGHPLSAIVKGIEHFWKVIEDSPALQARMLEQDQELRDKLAVLLRDEAATDLDAQLAAGFIATAHAAIFHTAVQRGLAGVPISRIRADQAAVIDRAFDAVEDALRCLGFPV